ncbi:Hypothetical predicted protein [Mytilus galloprovincialis]|uniref:Uncharacterized protein n=1 Tax=Mytilus galloprovincialis TaxID=29158 RepID=A0A8B6CBQ2_MYTGA|nr:Hypothetical predicted protein [Mytilus galloprovincialis]
MDITNTQTPKYKVLFGMKNNTLAKIQPTSPTFEESIEPWSGLNCDCYVNLWVAWLQWYIKAGTGIRGNGEGEFINLTDLFFYGEIIDIEIYSTSHAYWNFEFTANSTNACTSTVPGSNDTAVNTTTTTSSTANMIQTNLSATEPRCICSCDNITNTPLTNDELLQKIEQLRSELTVDTKKTSRYKRSLISTADDRSSSKCIGTISVVVLVIVIGVIVLMDFRHYALKIFPQKK